jgi:hypothetical protein
MLVVVEGMEALTCALSSRRSIERVANFMHAFTPPPRPG